MFLRLFEHLVRLAACGALRVAGRINAINRTLTPIIARIFRSENDFLSVAISAVCGFSGVSKGFWSSHFSPRHDDPNAIHQFRRPDQAPASSGNSATSELRIAQVLVRCFGLCFAAKLRQHLAPGFSLGEAKTRSISRETATAMLFSTISTHCCRRFTA